MENAKCQSSNFKSNPKVKYQYFLILEFDIDLAFACLPDRQGF